MLVATDFEIFGRWCQHFKEASALEFDHSPVPDVPLTHAPVPSFTYKEIATKTSKMMNGRVVGTDDVPSDFWKMCGPAVSCGSPV